LDSPDFADLEWPRYPKLLERIRALELEAARLRQREAAAAILWIKRAVRTYRIDASELALP
jgi:DNA-binding protein H-NS